MERTAPSWESPTTRTWVLRTAAETNGELFEQRVEYAPASPFPPAHLHPDQAEHFEVEAGAMIYMVEGDERRLEVGESLDLPPGTTHKARNASATDAAIVRWETRPALRSETFFRTAAVLGDAGLLDGALLAREYRDVFGVTGALGLAVPIVAAVARLLGRRLPAIETPSVKES
jgi:mannose-6-phosphate isomerase-like protein (cupin superfamily)